MKKLIGSDIGSYTFNKTSKQITLIGLSSILDISNILVITNVVSNVMIYNFSSNSLGGTIANNVITLNYDTSSMNNSDILQIFVDIPSNEESLHAILRRVVKLLESSAVVDSSNRQRVAVEALPSVVIASGTTAVTNVGGIGPSIIGNTPGGNPMAVTAAAPVLTVGLGPVDQKWQIIDQARASYNLGIRSQLSW